MLSVAILGSGFGCEVYAQALHPSSVFRLNTIFDKDLERAREAKRRFGFKEATNDWKEAISNKQVNLVFIATPVSTHFEMARMALEYGKNVVISAPFVQHAIRGEELARLAASRKLTAIVDYHGMFIPARRYVIELIKTGKVGLLHTVERTLKTREAMNEHLPIESKWKASHVEGGGLFWDTVPHDIDFFLRAIGGVHSVSAGLYSNLRSRILSTGESIACSATDGVSLQIRFHSGVDLHYSASTCSAIREQNEFVFHGNLGSLLLQNDTELIFYGRNGVKERLAIPPKLHLMTVPGHRLCTPFYAMAELLATALYNKTTANPGFDEALHTQRVMDAALLSAEQMRPVEVGEETPENPVVKPIPVIDKIF
jgi:predicted dehydrogenase